jgi:hypothetical protein
VNKNKPVFIQTPQKLSALSAAHRLNCSDASSLERAIHRAAASDESMLEARRALDRELKPHRGKDDGGADRHVGKAVLGSEAARIGGPREAELVLLVTAKKDDCKVFDLS